MVSVKVMRTNAVAPLILTQALLPLLKRGAETCLVYEERATLGPGDYFGEIALINNSTRSASVIAMTQALIYNARHEHRLRAVELMGVALVREGGRRWLRVVGVAKTHSFNRRPLEPITDLVIPPGHYYVQGTSPDSFDSRYRASGSGRSLRTQRTTGQHQRHQGRLAGSRRGDQHGQPLTAGQSGGGQEEDVACAELIELAKFAEGKGDRQEEWHAERHADCHALDGGARQNATARARGGQAPVPPRRSPG